MASQFMQLLEPRRLFVGYNGTDGDDNVVIFQGESPGWVAIKQFGINYAYSATDKLLMELGGGNDTVTVNLPESFSVTYPNFGIRVFGGAGNDTINGSHGGDEILGDAGDDFIIASGGNDKVFAGDGNDIISGSGGRDTLYGNAGNDSIKGGGHVDYIYGDDGADTLRGEAGDDHIQGNANPDRIRGGDGADHLYGAGGRDIIAGENGNDTLYGSAGSDVLAGGADHDTFGDAGPLDTNDFVAGEDIMLVPAASRAAGAAAGIGSLPLTGRAARELFANDEFSLL
jgi:Ca2+-binding RTX toxin-like protein